MEPSLWDLFEDEIVEAGEELIDLARRLLETMRDDPALAAASPITADQLEARIEEALEAYEAKEVADEAARLTGEDSERACEELEFIARQLLVLLGREAVASLSTGDEPSPDSGDSAVQTDD